MPDGSASIDSVLRGAVERGEVPGVAAVAGDRAGTAYEGGATYTYQPIPASILGYDATLNPSDNVVKQAIFATGAKVGITQKSYYLQDNWHVTDNFVARIGVRNDGFNNTNSLGQTYVSQIHSWQPRYCNSSNKLNSNGSNNNRSSNSSSSSSSRCSLTHLSRRASLPICSIQQ